jgi:hypothetical protein
VGDGGHTVEGHGRGERTDRVQARAGQWHPAHHQQHQPPAEEASGESDGHLQDEQSDPAHDRAGARAGRGEQHHHQGDADGVVGTGLAFENRSRATGDLALAEDREDHRRIRRGECRTEQERGPPVQTEDDVPEHA